MKKNRYLKLLIIIFVTVVATFLVCNLYRNYENNRLNKSYISKYVNNVSLKELSNTIIESGNNTFVYCGITGNDEIYKMEKELKKIIISNHVEDNFLYLDVTKIKPEDVNAVLGGDKKISKYPAIIYLRNGEVMDVLDSSTHMLNVSDYNNLLETYEVSDNE